MQLHPPRSTDLVTIVLSLSFLIVAGGCGSKAPKASVTAPSSPPLQSEFLYGVVGTEITAFTVNPTNGQVSIGPATPSSAEGNVVPDFTGKFLLVFSQPETAILGYTIDWSTGALTSVGGSPFPIVGTVTGNLVMSPTAEFAYVPTLAGLDAYELDRSSGTLTAIDGSPFSQSYTFYSAVVHPSGRFLYADGLFSDGQIGLFQFSIDAATGALTPIPPIPFYEYGLGTLVLTVDPSGKFLFQLSSNMGSFISEFDPIPIDGTTGSLGPFLPQEVDAGGFCLVPDVTGRFAYQCNSYMIPEFYEPANSLDAYDIEPNSGFLNYINSYQLDSTDFGIVLDPLGFLYLAQGGTLTTYKIGPAGDITPSANPLNASVGNLTVVTSH